jgi:4'-phosphopantetheinyl transferase
VHAAALVMLGSASPASPPELTALTAAERDRAAAFRRAVERDSYVAAHTLVRQCAARLAGIDPAAVQLTQCCPSCGGRDHGRPSVRGRTDLYVSLSHSRGVVAAAAGWAPVGVDVELRRDRTLEENLIRHALAPGEQALVRASDDPGDAFLRQWMRKEALIKVGMTTLGTLSDIDLSGLPLDIRRPSLRQTRYGQWHFLDWAGGTSEGLAAVSSQPMELMIQRKSALGTAWCR